MCIRDRSLTIRCLTDTYSIDVLEGMEQKAQVKVKKEYKEEKESFDLFWISYPRKTGKQKAWTYFKNNFAKIPFSTMIEHCKKAYTDTEKKYIPHPFTYLNQERYYDEVLQKEKSSVQLDKERILRDEKNRERERLKRMAEYNKPIETASPTEIKDMLKEWTR